MPDSTLLNTLTAVQQQVLQALVAGKSITAAAQEAGVHRTTVYLWTRQHPPFAWPPCSLPLRQPAQIQTLLCPSGSSVEGRLKLGEHLFSEQNPAISFKKTFRPLGFRPNPSASLGARALVGLSKSCHPRPWPRRSSN